MSGTKASGKATALTNKRKYGEDYYRWIGALGGAKSVTGGFYVNRELASRAGKLGGAKSRRISKLSDGQLRDMREQYNDGAPVKHLAEVYGISVSYCYRLCVSGVRLLFYEM